MIAGPRFLRVEGFLNGGSRYYREVVGREWNIGTLIEVHIGTTTELQSFSFPANHQWLKASGF